MDSHALLTKQGWRGTGNSLHPTNNSIGLAKPLLVGRKNDKIGLGKKVHQTSDIWWMQAFDESLKALDTTSKSGTMESSPIIGGLEAVKRGGGRWILANGGLYANFVKGTGLAGTMLQVKSSQNIFNSGDMISGESNLKTRESFKIALKEQILIEDSVKSGLSKVRKSKRRHETKEERKARKMERRLSRKKSNPKSTSHVSEEETSPKKSMGDRKKRKKASVHQKSEKNSHSELDDQLESIQKKKKRRKE